MMIETDLSEQALAQNIINGELPVCFTPANIEWPLTAVSPVVAQSGDRPLSEP